MALPEPALLFARFAQDAGTRGGARTYFQLLVTDLVKVQHPDAATVEGPGGRDWGIDTFVGQLAGGRIAVWQSKFVLDWSHNGPQGQIRKSFRDALAKADEKGHAVESWTLSLPCIPDPDQRRWFDGWARRESARTGVSIHIWDGIDLRHQLMRSDAEHVRRDYFPHTLLADMAPRYETVAVTNDLTPFADALFVRQLQAAGRVETDAACALYYATDVLVRDYTAKGSKETLSALDELHLNVHEIWERHFNNEAPTATSDGRMSRLHDLVLDAAGTCEDPPGINLRPAHRKGTAHRLVEEAKAGWVTHWKEIAETHAGAVMVPGYGGSATSAGIDKSAPLLDEPARPLVTLGADPDSARDSTGVSTNA